MADGCSWGASRRNVLLWTCLTIFIFAGPGILTAAECPPGTPNACFNAPGTASVCCSGSCGPSVGPGGEVATCQDGEPVPSLAVVVVFNFSDPLGNCRGQASAPGGAYKFGDVCTYYVPLLDTSGVQIGNAAYLENTILTDGSVDIVAKSSQSFYFGDNTLTHAAPDSISFEGETNNYVFQISIVGGTGKYVGARGYYISRATTVLQTEPDYTLAIPKDIYLF